MINIDYKLTPYQWLQFGSTFFYYILFLNFTILNWFCQISKWIRHRAGRLFTNEPPGTPPSQMPTECLHLMSHSEHMFLAGLYPSAYSLFLPRSVCPWLPRRIQWCDMLSFRVYIIYSQALTLGSHCPAKLPDFSS